MSSQPIRLLVDHQIRMTACHTWSFKKGFTKIVLLNQAIWDSLGVSGLLPTLPSPNRRCYSSAVNSADTTAPP